MLQTDSRQNDAPAPADDALRIGDYTIHSRLIIGSGKYPSAEVMRLAHLNAAFETGIENPLDAAIVFANVSGFAQEAAIRIHWSAPMAAEIPWYVTEVPTVFVSLSLPNHLIDVPMVKTMIHAYAPTREAIRAVVEKIQGLSPFQGTFNENVFCDSWETRR